MNPPTTSPIMICVVSDGRYQGRRSRGAVAGAVVVVNVMKNGCGRVSVSFRVGSAESEEKKIVFSFRGPRTDALLRVRSLPLSEGRASARPLFCVATLFSGRAEARPSDTGRAEARPFCLRRKLYSPDAQKRVPPRP